MMLFSCTLWLRAMGPIPPAVENTKGEKDPC